MISEENGQVQQIETRLDAPARDELADMLQIPPDRRITASSHFGGDLPSVANKPHPQERRCKRYKRVPENLWFKTVFNHSEPKFFKEPRQMVRYFL